MDTISPCYKKGKSVLNEKNVLFEYSTNLKAQSDAQFYRL